MIKCNYSEKSNIKEFTECIYPEECEKKLMYGVKNYCIRYQEKREKPEEFERKLDQN